MVTRCYSIQYDFVHSVTDRDHCVVCCRRERDHDKTAAADKDAGGTWAEQLEAAEQAAKVDEYVHI